MSIYEWWSGKLNRQDQAALNAISAKLTALQKRVEGMRIKGVSVGVGGVVGTSGVVTTAAASPSKPKPTTK